MKAERSFNFDRIQIRVSVDAFTADQKTDERPAAAWMSGITTLICSPDEVKRFKKLEHGVHKCDKNSLDEFWKSVALLLTDSFVDETERIDEITGHPGYKFGKKVD